MSVIIPAEPFDFSLKTENPCLIVIDMQKDFLYPAGFGASLGNNVSLLEPAVPIISKLLSVFRSKKLPIIHTREAHKPDLSDCYDSKRLRGNPQLKIGDKGPMGRILIDGEEGADIIDELKPLAGEYEIVKPGKGAFYNTELPILLKKLKVKQLIFTGVTTEVCVQTTMREANDRGFECLLVEDGTESYFPEYKQQTINMITAQNAIVGWVAHSLDVIDAIEEL